MMILRATKKERSRALFPHPSQVAPRGSLIATSRAVTSSAFGARSYAAASSRATALAGSRRRQWAIMQFGEMGVVA